MWPQLTWEMGQWGVEQMECQMSTTLPQITQTIPVDDALIEAE